MHINFSMEYKEFNENYLYKKPFIFKNALDVSSISWKEINECINVQTLLIGNLSSEKGK